MSVGDDIEDEDTKEVKVHFRSSMFGSFTQWVVFDYGRRPVIVKKLSFTIGGDCVADVECDGSESATSDTDCWDTSNRTIVPFASTWKGDATFTKHYRPSDFSTTDPGELSSENYKYFMHEMLKVEETERRSQIKR